MRRALFIFLLLSLGSTTQASHRPDHAKTLPKTTASRHRNGHAVRRVASHRIPSQSRKERGDDRLVTETQVAVQKPESLDDMPLKSPPMKTAVAKEDRTVRYAAPQRAARLNGEIPQREPTSRSARPGGRHNDLEPPLAKQEDNSSASKQALPQVVSPPQTPVVTAAQGSAADPSDANVIAARTIAARLLDSCRSGALVLSHPDREGETLRQLADVGHCMGPDGAPVTLAPALLRTLDRLTAQSTADKPLEILSLYRPLPAGRPHEPHGNGMAVDIAAFAGHRIRSTDPEECVAGVLAVIQTLDPGAYRLGLPRPPDTDPAASTTTTTSSDRNSNWPFFPAPQVVIDVETSSTDTPDSDPNTLTAGKATSKSSAHPRVIRWANEHYAPLADVGSSHVRAAIEAAIARGVNIHSLFPDAPDHLHLDVKPNP